MKKKALAIVFFLLASLVTSVYSEENNQNRWYVGTTMGWSNLLKHKSNISEMSQENILKEQKSASILGLFFGYEFNPYFSLEIENNTNGFFSSSLYKNYGNIQDSTVQVATKISYPMTEELSFYTRLGGTLLWTDLISKNTFHNIATKDTSLLPSISLGAEYVFYDHLITRLNYNWKDHFKNIVDSSIQPDLGDIIFSIGWKFGKSNVNDIFSSYDPEFLSTQYSVLNENITFPFNSSELKPISYDKLNKLHEDIKKMRLKNMFIVLLGHSDRIGNQKYNQKLSEDRAYNIKNYLTSKGFSRDKIVVRGVGDLYPLTNQVCNNIVHKPLLVSCLAPDRRVEIEVLSDIQN
ncbi:hypothetical protein D9V74_01575 [Buchnera aphidicola (Macrosiphoniella sanborni)]|uniref:Outer membrane protein A n=1 Tax=Buchnera aphidicola (Macrosiphoniella sanborni) TaxID=1241865 RepID=A0A4D6YD04_9GAMM|nr:OmpA family protein [Buchnera aphidicola]QCI23868.1 hypothetical protein D9V74_01575 [Buchnera aphidicola (Macrosiphoniella sanborni)]